MIDAITTVGAATPTALTQPAGDDGGTTSANGSILQADPEQAPAAPPSEQELQAARAWVQAQLPRLIVWSDLLMAAVQQSQEQVRRCALALSLHDALPRTGVRPCDCWWAAETGLPNSGGAPAPGAQVFNGRAAPPYRPATRSPSPAEGAALALWLCAGSPLRGGVLAASLSRLPVAASRCGTPRVHARRCPRRGGARRAAGGAAVRVVRRPNPAAHVVPALQRGGLLQVRAGPWRLFSSLPWPVRSRALMLSVCFRPVFHVAAAVTARWSTGPVPTSSSASCWWRQAAASRPARLLLPTSRRSSHETRACTPGPRTPLIH